MPGTRTVMVVSACLAAIVSCWCACAAACAADLPAGAEVMMKAPEVESGLSARVAAGRRLVVAPGRCWVNDKPVDLRDPAEIEIPAAAPIDVRDESYAIEEPGSLKPIWDRALEKSLAGGKGRFPMPGILIHSSVKVRPLRATARGAAAGPQAQYKLGIDYEIDPKYSILTRIPAGGIKQGETVRVDYQLKSERISTLVLTANGELRLVAGEASQFAPEPPQLPSGCLALANVLSKSGQASSSRDILPIAAVGVSPLPPARREANRKALSKALAKLAAGEPLKIAFWGDSVTCGGFASRPEQGFPALLVSRLSERANRISVVKACLDGSTTSMRLPNFQSEVLSARPDVIVVEFVNDLLLPESVIQTNYASFIKQARAAGAEVILCLPHLPHPRHLKLNQWNNVAAAPSLRALRAVAEREPVAVADVAGRWERAQKEGLTPELLLKDRILHPNDRGHAVYAEELMKCFQ